MPSIHFVISIWYSLFFLKKMVLICFFAKDIYIYKYLSFYLSFSLSLFIIKLIYSSWERNYSLISFTKGVSDCHSSTSIYKGSVKVMHRWLTKWVSRCHSSTFKYKGSVEVMVLRHPLPLHSLSLSLSLSLFLGSMKVCDRWHHFPCTYSRSFINREWMSFQWISPTQRYNC